MNEELSSTQLDAIEHMPAEQRYDYFITKILKLEQVWSLWSEDGWLILPEDDDEHLPVWPHAELAARWTNDDLADCRPKAISLDDWLSKWLPGMENDELLVAVCPNIAGDSIVVSAAELREQLNDSRR